METRLLHDYFWNFGCVVKDIITRGEIEMNIGKLGKLEKPKFPFQVEGTFGDDIWYGRGSGQEEGGMGRSSRWGAVWAQIRWVGGS